VRLQRAAVAFEERGEGDLVGVGWALNPELVVENSEPVRQPDEAAAVGPGAADAVRTRSSRVPSSTRPTAVARCARECLATLVSASATTK
jgi:hypothetical protein